MIGRSAIFTPANQPHKINSTIVMDADSIIFDLEDSVTIAEKDAARILLREALINLDFIKEKSVLIRVNNPSTTYFKDDIDELFTSSQYPLVIPKADMQIISLANDALRHIEIKNKLLNKITIVPLIETANGIESINEILRSSDRIIGILFGAEDFTTDMGVARTSEGNELLYARSKLALAAHAAGIEILDTVFTDINDTEGLKKDALVARQLGFTGKLVIHPSQIDIIHEIFTPSKIEIDYSLKLIRAFSLAEKAGKGVCVVDGKMIDTPIIKKAKLLLKRAKLHQEDITND